MRINTVNLQIVRNLGNYETLRIGAEFTPDSNMDLAQAMAAGYAELQAVADGLIGKKVAPAAAPAAAAPAATPAPAPAPAPAQAKAEPDMIAQLNQPKEGDTRDVMTFAQVAKLNKTVERIKSGVKAEQVFSHFRFDEQALAIVRAAIEGSPVDVNFANPLLQNLCTAKEQGKAVDAIVACVRFDEQAASAWDMCVKLN